LDCTKAFASASQNSSKMLRWISLRVSASFAKGAGIERFCASLSPRSTATQHIRREWRNSLRPPRTSQMPSSGVRQFAHTQSSVFRTPFQSS